MWYFKMPVEMIKDYVKDFAEDYGPEIVIDFLKSKLKVENLPKLKKVTLLAADQNLAIDSWQKLESVVSKYGKPDFSFIGKDKFSPELEATVRDALSIMIGETVDDVIAVTHSNMSATANLDFNLPATVWFDSGVAKRLEDFLDDKEVFRYVFASMSKVTTEINKNDPLFYLARLSPVLVLYLVLILLSDKEKIAKLNPVFDLLSMGIVPYCDMEFPNGKSNKWYVVVDK